MPEDLSDIAAAVDGLADAITPRCAAPGQDSFGGHIESLTEAMMGISTGLSEIGSALSRIADTMERRDD